MHEGPSFVHSAVKLALRGVKPARDVEIKPRTAARINLLCILSSDNLFERSL